MGNHLEQVYLNMPEADFYFAGDQEQKEENLKAYVGEQRLTFQSLQKFSESNTELYYYIALDVSASYPESEFRSICEALSTFGDTIRDQDHCILVTFGDDVNIEYDLTGKELHEGGADKEILAALSNRDMNTSLYEAFSQIAGHSRQASEAARKVVFVITDGMDDTVGKSGGNEALSEIKDAGLTVYGLAVPQAKQEAVNALGEYVRSTGGYLTMMEEGKETDALTGVSDYIMNCYKAVFTASSNKISNDSVTATLEWKDTSEKQSMEVKQTHWIKDTENPTIVQTQQISNRQIKVVFSEAVTGSDAAENFVMKTENGEELIPVYTSEGSNKESVLLTFANDLEAGNYTLECKNIKDISMEENALEENGSLTVEPESETEAVTEQTEESFLQAYGIQIAIPAVPILAAIVYLIRKKRKQKQEPEKKESQPSAESQKQTVFEPGIMAERKMVVFQVKGRGDEVRMAIKNSMIVGRSKSCNLSFNDPTMSRQHFALAVKNGEILINNLSKSSYTMVNDIKLTDTEQTIHSGDRIKAGQTELMIRWE